MVCKEKNKPNNLGLGANLIFSVRKYLVTMLVLSNYLSIWAKEKKNTLIHHVQYVTYVLYQPSLAVLLHAVGSTINNSKVNANVMPMS